MKKSYLFLWLLCFSCVWWTGCSDDDNESVDKPTERITTNEIYYANYFASDVLSDVYVWNKEISADIAKLDPETNEDPIGTVSEIRYKKDGKEMDKWTMLTNDVESLTSSLEGVETTFGYSLALGKFSNTGNYFFVVSYVYPDSPAAKAGFKRGDIIMQLDGQDITKDNYLNALYNSTISLGMGEQQPEGGISLKGETIELTAVKMYEDPIVVEPKVFDCGGKKVGYLVYTGFDLASAQKLVDICRNFKEEGITELILDLRYNGGGYVFTECLLASMLAPESAVSAGGVYQTEQWNDEYMAYWKEENADLNTYFSTEHKLASYGLNINTQDANIGLNKIYALISSGTASASEGLLIGLMPYMDVQLIGTNSHGKYCTGIVFESEDIYKNPPKELDNWGIYVMVSFYADKNGENPCMPDGLVPDVSVEDDVMDGYQLGDENETMLHAALELAGKTDFAPASRSISASVYETRPLHVGSLFGKRIDTRLKDKIELDLE